MTVREWTGAASTVENAVLKGLKALGLHRDQVEIKVLGEKTSGLFSLFGFRRMEVQLLVKPGARRHEREERQGRGFDRGEWRNDRPERENFRNEGREGRGDRGRRGDSRRDAAPSREGTRGDNRGDRGPRRDDRPSNQDRPRDERPRDEGLRNDRGERGPRRDGRQDQGQDRNNRSGERPREDRSRDDRPFNRDRPRNDRPQGGGRRGPPPREEAPAGESPRRDDRPVQEPPSPDSLLNQWKELLGWDSLAWTPRNGESGDITLVLDKASGEKLAEAGDDALEALQHLLSAVRSKYDRGAPRVFLEVEGQAAMNERSIVDEARNAAAEVQRTGEPYRLPPMDSRDRRLVHQTLAGHPDVETASEGEGQWRKVVVKPKNRS